MREYVINKLDRVTRHFDQVVDITVLLSVEKQKEKERRQKAEVNLHVKGRDIHVEHANEDLYAAIDQLVDKLDRQVCRHKDRVQDHNHASVKRIGGKRLSASKRIHTSGRKAAFFAPQQKSNNHPSMRAPPLPAGWHALP